MAATLKLVAVGTSTGIVIPKDVLSRLRLDRGSHLHLVETSDGLFLSPYDAEVEKQIKIGEQIMDQYRETFKALAE